MYSNTFGIGSVDTYLSIAANLKINIALCGAHGRAKTSVIEQYCKENGYDLEIIILSRMTPEDMIGLPTTGKLNGEKVTKFSSPDWLVHACDGKSKVLIFFDEFNNAELDTQASILDLIESRRANGMTLNDDCQIVMAYNPMSIAPHARNFAKATRDRICVIPITDNASLKSYRKYYENNDMAGLVDVIDSIDGLVNNYDDEVTEEAYDNAEFTFRSLEKSYNIVKYCYDNDISIEYADTMVCGYAGKIGSAFTNAAFCQLKDSGRLQKVKKIIKEHGIDYFMANANKIGIVGKSSEWSFDDNVLVVNCVRQALNDIDFDKFLRKYFTKEFVSKYEQLSD